MGIKWVDKGLYWSGSRGEGPSEPPYEKEIKFAKIRDQDYKDHAGNDMVIACTVVNVGAGEVDVNRAEIEWHRQNGAEVIFP